MTDNVYLSKNCMVGAKEARPNHNELIVGSPGVGKSVSVALPTMLSMENSSLIASFTKPGEARSLAAYMMKKGYDVQICDLSMPEKSSVFFDPIQYLNSYDDINQISTQIVTAILSRTVDDFWNSRAIPLLNALITATIMTRETESFSDVLDLFDRMKTSEQGSGIVTGADELFSEIKKAAPDCYAVREFENFRNVAPRTASSIRQTLAGALSAVFPESVRTAMRHCDTIDFESIASKKTALFLITSPVNTSLYNFANLLFSTAVKQLLEYAQRCPENKLPVPVKLIFDDFAVGAKIQDYAKQIAIFRSAGISSMMLLQSESQLRAIYGDGDAETIINCCGVYTYFPGGMDLLTCRSISTRMDMPLEDVMYAPLGNVFVMRSGHRPLVDDRFNTFEMKEFQEMETLMPHKDADR